MFHRFGSSNTCMQNKDHDLTIYNNCFNTKQLLRTGNVSNPDNISSNINTQHCKKYLKFECKGADCFPHDDRPEQNHGGFWVISSICAELIT